MRLGYIGLGKMGYNMVVRLRERGYEVLAFDIDEKARKGIRAKGIKTADSLEILVKELIPPRLVWLMVPQEKVEGVIKQISPHLKKADAIIDGGNSYYEDSVRRGKLLALKGIHFLDVGVSGGPKGARDGACIMVGGEKADYEKLKPLFRDLAFENGYGYMGKTGAGHFVKMVHNGIEYGMMQSLAEGFTILKESPFKLNLRHVAEIYDNGSVIESRLVGWLKTAYQKYGAELKEVSGAVGATGEGAWTVKTARKRGIPTPIIKGACDFRAKSKKNPSYTGKILSALREQFGGHEAHEKK
jgi:6-phosphogluconate dehydrogenase